ncbi:MAG: hypothetical protein GJ680_19895 [Alteromonadaceae bacterium]|nr:hypothetical protein [Alteromonadaceae bacterium]
MQKVAVSQIDIAAQPVAKVNSSNDSLLQSSRNDFASYMKDTNSSAANPPSDTRRVERSESQSPVKQDSSHKSHDSVQADIEQPKDDAINHKPSTSNEGSDKEQGESASQSQSNSTASDKTNSEEGIRDRDPENTPKFAENKKTEISQDPTNVEQKEESTTLTLGADLLIENGLESSLHSEIPNLSPNTEELLVPLDAGVENIEAHESLVNILESLHGKFTQPEQVDDGVVESPEDVDVGQLIDLDVPKSHTSTSIDKKPEIPEELMVGFDDSVEQVIVDTETLKTLEPQAEETITPTATTVTDMEAWKQQLREKLLSEQLTFSKDSETLTDEQLIAVKTELNELSQTELANLIGDDEEVKQAILDVLNDLDSDNTLGNEVALTEIFENSDEIENIDLALLVALTGEQSEETTDVKAEVIPQVAQSKPSQDLSNNVLNEDTKTILKQIDEQLVSDESKLATLENILARVSESADSVTPEKQKFISSLKVAVDEFKAQLKSGHEPGIDMQSVVAQAMNDGQGAGSENLESSVQQILQQAAQITTLSKGLDSEARELITTQLQAAITSKESSQTTTANISELNKQSQNNQILDKPINITKPEAATELANKVQVMVNQNRMIAEIRLDPPDLGQMQIKIAMQGDTATVNIVVQSQQARETLEHATPRLKELLEEQGIELGQSSVQQEGQDQQFANGGDGEGSKGGAESLQMEEESEVVSNITVNEPEGIDYFA